MEISRERGRNRGFNFIAGGYWVPLEGPHVVAVFRDHLVEGGPFSAAVEASSQNPILLERASIGVVCHGTAGSVDPDPDRDVRIRSGIAVESRHTPNRTDIADLS